MKRLLKRMAAVALPEIQKRLGPLGQFARVDTERRRVFISDELVRKAIALAVSRLEDGRLLEFGRGPGGYECCIRSAGSSYRVVASLSRVSWQGRSVTVHLDTPEPPRIEDRPILTFVAGAISSMFGGTAAAETILSARLPGTSRWDGRRATITFDVSSAAALPQWIRDSAVPVAIDVAQDSSGVWLQLADERAQVSQLAEWMSLMVAQLVTGHPR